MHSAPRSIPSHDGAQPALTNQYDDMIGRLEAIVLDGIRHGYFESQVSCEMTNGRKRRVIIKAGKSYQFTISEDELPSDS